ncbi:MAG: hypothetical protein ACI4RL_00885 [Ruminococcus sp.]
MKKLIPFLLIVLTLLCACDSEDSKEEKTKKLSNNIADMEVMLDKEVISLKDKMTIADLEKMGFSTSKDYRSVAEESLAPCKNADNLQNVGVNMVTKSKKLFTVSVVNLSEKKQKAKDCTVYFISSGSTEDYDHTYTLPSKVAFQDSDKDIIKKIGEPNIDLRNMDFGKMIQYVSTDGTFTANLDNDMKMTAFSYTLSNGYLFGED